MDNRIFNVNGSGRELLARTLALVFDQEGTHTRCRAWEFSMEKGLILLWSDSTGTSFPSPLTCDSVLPFVWEWLRSEEAAAVQKTDWDAVTDHDGSDGDGWRVYVEDWGHVGDHHAAICAIKPVVLWYGK